MCVPTPGEGPVTWKIERRKRMKDALKVADGPRVWVGRKRREDLGGWWLIKVGNCRGWRKLS